jgi:hypothetical protein
VSVFSTEFVLEKGCEPIEVIELASKWLIGSPHSTLRVDELKSVPIQDEKVIQSSDSNAVFISVEFDGQEMSGVRYEKREKNLLWTTSIVARKSSEGLAVGIRVVCEGLSALEKIPRPKKPYFVKQALQEFGGGQDGAFPVTDKPIYLDEGQEHIAAALMQGEAGNRLPLVYVSSGFNGRFQVDPKKLAQQLSGLAHVVIEPSLNFSCNLRGLVKDNNVYGGTVGVYWSDTGVRRSFFKSEESISDEEIHRKLIGHIQETLAGRRQQNDCTWASLRELYSDWRMAEVKSEAKPAEEKIKKEFQALLSAKDERIRELKEGSESLKSQLKQLAQATSGSAGPYLKSCSERDFFAGEISDTIVDALNAFKPSLNSESRRFHIVEALLEANPKVGKAREKAEEVKRILRGYKKMDKKTRAALIGLGFEIEEDGKHHKLIYSSDPRYTFTGSKTGSEYRGGKNFASEINRILFN